MREVPLSHERRRTASRAKPFKALSKVNLLKSLSTFGDKHPQKLHKWLPNRTWDTPRRTFRGANLTLRTRREVARGVFLSLSLALAPSPSHSPSPSPSLPPSRKRSLSLHLSLSLPPSLPPSLALSGGEVPPRGSARGPCCSGRWPAFAVPHPACQAKKQLERLKT